MKIYMMYLFLRGGEQKPVMLLLALTQKKQGQQQHYKFLFFGGKDKDIIFLEMLKPWEERLDFCATESQKCRRN